MTSPQDPYAGQVLSPGEVGALFRVHPKTVTRWAKQHRLGPVFRTPGGHRRYDSAFVHGLLDQPGDLYEETP